jgi:hypothetical protein
MFYLPLQAGGINFMAAMLTDYLILNIRIIGRIYHKSNEKIHHSLYNIT